MTPLTLALLVAAPLPPDPPPPEQVQRLLKQLGDPDAKSRNEAIATLRPLARRVDRVGGQRAQRGGEFAPKVRGLVLHLIRAAGDEDEANRVAVLHALADTRDPAAAAIRGRLKDGSQAVRFQAACL